MLLVSEDNTVVNSVKDLSRNPHVLNSSKNTDTLLSQQFVFYSKLYTINDNATNQPLLFNLYYSIKQRTISSYLLIVVLSG